MPARQPTPGPSTLGVQADTLQLYNTKKRAVSENTLEDEQRQAKKHRKDTETENQPVEALGGPKDSKKKRRKRKKKSPLTIPDTNHEITSIHTRSKGPIPLSTVSSTTLSETSISSPTTNTVEVVNCETPTVLAKSLICKTEEDEQLTLNFIDKGKAKALSESPDILISQLNEFTGAPVVTDPMKEAQAKIAELTAQLEAQKTLLSRHEDNLSQLQQSLTCQICLDLLYKPYALSPCGHIACYLCLVRWFTSVQNDNPNANAAGADPVTGLDDVARLLNSQPANRGIFLRNHKSCPLCRAEILQRPAEIWSIKSMVAHLIKSKLVETPSAPPPSSTETPNANERLNAANDPWRNIFGKPYTLRRRRQPQLFPPPPANQEDPGADWGVADMGMYDAEDGGIYRCLDCMHEIWGGACTNCEREYAGHVMFDDDDEDDDFSDGSVVGPGFLGRRLREIWGGYARDNGGMGWAIDSEDDDMDDHEIGEGEIDDGEINVGMLYEPPFGIDLTDGSTSEEGSGLEDDEEGRFTSSSEDGEGSERNWNTDDGDGEEGDDDALTNHQMDVMNMIHDDPLWPFGQGLPFREPGGGAYIEEVDVAEEEEDDDNAEVYHSGSDSHSHSYPNSGEEDEGVYEGSFIDDDEEDGANGHAPHDHSQGQDNVIDLVDSDNDDDGNNRRAIALARRLGGGMRLGVAHTVENGDESEEGDIGVGHHRRRGVGPTARRIVHEEPSDSDQEEEQAIRPAGRRRRNPRRGGATASRRPALFEDEEDE